MPTGNRDASQVTLKNRGIALNAYKSSWTAATVNSSAPTQGLAAPAATSAEVLGQIRTGCEACYALTNEAAKQAGSSYDPNISVYPFNPTSGGASSLTGSS